MTAARDGEISVAEQIKRIPSATRPTVQAARRTEPVVGIGTFSTYATLFFYRGRELEDASEVLEGSGKDARFLRLRTPADAVRPDVRRLVRRAFALSKD
jgi:hypothetical protein